MSNYILTPAKTPFTIERSGNATTGYTWSILLSPALKLIDHDYQVINDKPGAGGVKRWTIQAQEPGIFYIALWNHRPWEKSTPFDAKLITVEVTEDMLQLTLHLKDRHLIGYSKGAYTYNTEGHQVYLHPDESIPINLKVNPHWVSLSFYYLNGELVYHEEDDYRMTDRPFCISNLQGETLGCPSGGLSGKGDGRLPQFKSESYHIGTMKIRS